MAEPAGRYPASLSVDYPERSDRLTTVFRLLLVIPIFIILALLAGWNHESDSVEGWKHGYSAIGFVFAPLVLMMLFRKKYPRWWFDWNLELTRFGTRVGSYMMLLRDEYPSTDEEQAVHIEIPYPDAENDLHRALPLVKWFLAIPHLIVLWILWIAAVVCVVVAWFAILFMGRYPRDLFNFVVGVMQWSLRVDAYAFLLTTDEYPPFRLYD